jgi:hypothetical protein
MANNATNYELNSANRIWLKAFSIQNYKHFHSWFLVQGKYKALDPSLYSTCFASRNLSPPPPPCKRLKLLVRRRNIDSTSWAEQPQQLIDYEAISLLCRLTIVKSNIDFIFWTVIQYFAQLCAITKVLVHMIWKLVSTWWENCCPLIRMLHSPN